MAPLTKTLQLIHLQSTDDTTNSFLKIIFKHCHSNLNTIFSRIKATNLVILQKRSIS